MTNEGIRIENEMLLAFVKENPYPTYEVMLNKLNAELWAEYGKINHVCCKIIYENPTNKDLIVEMGKKIYECGGIRALYANHDILNYHSPYGDRKNHNVIRSQARMIEFYFEDVCSEWKA
jgi:hypothetical protein